MWKCSCTTHCLFSSCNLFFTYSRTIILSYFLSQCWAFITYRWEGPRCLASRCPGGEGRVEFFRVVLNQTLIWRYVLMEDIIKKKNEIQIKLWIQVQKKSQKKLQLKKKKRKLLQEDSFSIDKNLGINRNCWNIHLLVSCLLTGLQDRKYLQWKVTGNWLKHWKSIESKCAP